MFKRKNLKKILVSSLAIVILLGTVAGVAAGVKKNILVTEGVIKFQHNGVDVTKQVESKYGTPGFILEGKDRSYAPVRAIADILGVNVEWDHATRTANFVDVKQIILQEQLLEKNDEIEKLKKEIKELKEGKTGDLNKLEKDLQKDYGKYEYIDFDISLKGDEKKIDVKIEANLKGSQKDDWKDLRVKDREKLMENIADDIAKEFKNADIKGEIYDKYDRETLYTFEKKSGKKIEIKNKDSKGDKLSDIERDLEREIEKIFDREDIKDAKLVKLDERRRGKEAKVEIEFRDRYEKEWKDLSKTNVRKMLDDVAYYIEDNVDYMDVFIDVFMDGDLVAEYDKLESDKTGVVKISKR